jgi:hypothetical protein
MEKKDEINSFLYNLESYITAHISEALDPSNSRQDIHNKKKNEIYLLLREDLRNIILDK